MTSRRRIAVTMLAGAALASGCPTSLPVLPPLPPAVNEGTTEQPPEVERPTPPEQDGDVPEVPPPVKP